MTQEQRQETIAKYHGKRYELAQRARDIAGMVTSKGQPENWAHARALCQQMAEVRAQCLCEADFVAELAYCLL